MTISPLALEKTKVNEKDTWEEERRFPIHL